MGILALNEQNEPVDWWFVCKLPLLNNPTDKAGADLGAANGTEYLYCGAVSPALPKALSGNNEILKAGALFNTLQQLRDAVVKNPQIGWFFYNDEYTKTGRKANAGVAPNKANNPSNGHTKGVLAYDLGTNTAIPWVNAHRRVYGTAAR